jgi:hypothetical protein
MRFDAANVALFWAGPPWRSEQATGNQREGTHRFSKLNGASRKYWFANQVQVVFGV